MIILRQNNYSIWQSEKGYHGSQAAERLRQDIMVNGIGENNASRRAEDELLKKAEKINILDKFNKLSKGKKAAIIGTALAGVGGLGYGAYKLAKKKKDKEKSKEEK